MRLGRLAGSDTDIAARGDNAIKCGPVYDQIFNDRKSFCAEGFYGNHFAVVKVAHVQLAQRRGF
jgi:hypothetical protein